MDTTGEFSSSLFTKALATWDTDWTAEQIETFKKVWEMSFVRHERTSQRYWLWRTPRYFVETLRMLGNGNGKSGFILLILTIIGVAGTAAGGLRHSAWQCA